MATMLKLYVDYGRGFGRLNRAHIVLIPKKSDIEEVGDYGPISLTHSVVNLFSKVLAIRARRCMQEVVASNQSAFIKKRSLHENFLLVRQVARKIHVRREAGLFLKLDISRDFDSLSCPFLFEVLRAKGFGRKWINWISMLIRTTTTKVIVNGVPGKPFDHACGMRQGDPISLLLFVIAMDMLTSIMIKATEENVVSSFIDIKSL
ncbi:reverse transcriptase [Hordeum vulgare]|nr:reverse transcriptase [Hordeum vulgare]